MWRVFVGHEAARLILQEDQVFGHPGGAWELEEIHEPLSVIA
jgi:hypothetical protein